MWSLGIIYEITLLNEIDLFFIIMVIIVLEEISFLSNLDNVQNRLQTWVDITQQGEPPLCEVFS
jgi:hypothetical protein